MMKQFEWIVVFIALLLVVVTPLHCFGHPTTSTSDTNSNNGSIRGGSTTTTTSNSKSTSISTSGGTANPQEQQQQQKQQQQQRPSAYPVKEYIFNAVIDHFNFRPTTVPTFPLYYYVNDDHFYADSNSNSNSTNSDSDSDSDSNTIRPVFFYAGNEADIMQFVNNSGFMFEIAKEFNAMVVFAEHRYYGLSNPFGNEYAMGVPYNVSFLTVEQAMEDYNTLNVHIQQQWKLSKANNPFVVFGGSYGGNLALWLRLKNPNLWSGAIASSATPLKHILRQTNHFAQIETQAYGNYSNGECPNLIRMGWDNLYKYSKTKMGRQLIIHDLKLCPTTVHEYYNDNDNDSSDIADDIYGWIGAALETMVQYGYPYPTSFYNPLPGYPFRVACDQMMLQLANESKSKRSGLNALYAAANVYYNYTGQAGGCFHFDNDVIQQTQQHWKRNGRHDMLYQLNQRLQNRERRRRNSQKTTTSSTSSTTIVLEDDSNNNNNKEQQEQNQSLSWTETMDGWDYQTCTEVYQPMPTNGITDYYLPYTPNATAYYKRCATKWGGVTPRPNWEEMTFMSDNIGIGPGNIFLSSGQFDPWRAAGIQSIPKGATTTTTKDDDCSSIVVRIIEYGAHHYDLRSSHPLDPQSVIQVRNEERVCIQKWIQQWQNIYSL